MHSTGGRRADLCNRGLEPTHRSQGVLRRIVARRRPHSDVRAPLGRRTYGKDGRVVFAVIAPYDKGPATVGNGTMIAFHLETPDAVTAFYRKALELGAKDEGAPGYRGGSPFFMSYFRDLDGNKLCAYHQGQSV